VQRLQSSVECYQVEDLNRAYPVNADTR
jgi:hypothetical protein